MSDEPMFPVYPKPEVEFEPCKGQLYRCRINNHVHGDRITFQTTFTLLRRRSCKGCDKCGWVEDDLREMMPLFPKNPQDGAVYAISIANAQRDWESGWIDSWDLVLEKVDDSHQ